MFLSTASGIWKEVPLCHVFWSFTIGLHSVRELKQSILKFSERNLLWSCIRWLETICFKSFEAFNSDVDDFCTTKYSNTRIKYSNDDNLKKKYFVLLTLSKGIQPSKEFPSVFISKMKFWENWPDFTRVLKILHLLMENGSLGMSLSSFGNEFIHETFAEQVMSTELNYCASFITHGSLDFICLLSCFMAKVKLIKE